MITVILSKSTQSDIDELFMYGSHHFGKIKAVEYLEGLKSCFETLAKHPDTGKQRNEIKSGLLSLPYKSHIIFYRMFKKHIRIVRVLYGGRDLMKFL